MIHQIGIIILVSFISACGHMINPAPPKVELTSTKDQSCTCEEINTEILDLQAKRVSTQKQIDNQKAQNIISGIGGWLVIVPFVFLDVTTQKNAAYASYEEREEYLRKIATDKGCANLPRPYEFPTQQEQASFVPSGGNLVQAKLDRSNSPVPVVDPFEPWTGKWLVQGSSSHNGIWALKQTDKTVVSTDESFLKAKGAVSGNQFEGAYTNTSYKREYGFKFVISTDAMSFEGFASDNYGSRPVRGERCN
jgi:hypothetical protein